MKKLGALTGMLPKKEAGHTDGLTVPYNWFQQTRNALGSTEHGVSSGPLVGNPEANGREMWFGELGGRDSWAMDTPGRELGKRRMGAMAWRARRGALPHCRDWFWGWRMYHPHGNPRFCMEPICLPASTTHVVRWNQDRVQGGLYLEGFPILCSKVTLDTGSNGESARTREGSSDTGWSDQALSGIFEFFFILEYF